MHEQVFRPGVSEEVLLDFQCWVIDECSWDEVFMEALINAHEVLTKDRQFHGVILPLARDEKEE